MKINVFVPPSPADHHRYLTAFATGAARCGEDVGIYDMTYRDCDVAVVFGIRKEAVPASYARGEIIAKHRALGKDVLVLERGFVRRDIYYSAGWNGINGRADFCNTDVADDRWKALGVDLMPRRKAGEYIIVCGQVPWDAAVQHIDYLQWLKLLLLHLVEHGWPVIFRPHPNVGLEVYELDKSEILKHVIVSEWPLEDCLPHASCVIAFNSNSTVEAMIAGVPVLSFDEGAMALPVSALNFDDAISPIWPDEAKRQIWATSLAYAQWTLEEFEQGLPWLHLKQKVS